MPPLRPLRRPSIHTLSLFLLNPHLLRPCSQRASLHLSTHPPPPTPKVQPHHHLTSRRAFTTSLAHPTAPKSHDRGPPSKEETQTNFSSLDVLGGTPAPSTSIDACLWDGFHLNSGVKIVGSGVLLVGGEAFGWCPWEAGGGLGVRQLVNGKGQWEVGDEAWGLLGLVWPKPDLLILGLGKEMRPISPKTRLFINSLGIRVDIQDTRNAAAQFNLLATERGVTSVAAALVPMGWREGVGIKSGS